MVFGQVVDESEPLKASCMRPKEPLEVHWGCGASNRDPCGDVQLAA